MLLAAKDKENADKPKFRKLLSKSDLSAAAPPPVFLKQRSALAPRQDSNNIMSASIHGDMPKFQLKSDHNNNVAVVSRSIHTINPALVMQKPKQPVGNAFTFDLKGNGSNNTVPTKSVPPPVLPTKFSNPVLLLPKQQPVVVKSPPSPPRVVKAVDSPPPRVVKAVVSPPPRVVKTVASPPPRIVKTVASPPPPSSPMETEQVDPAVALQMRRKAEMQRKGADMVSRARALEAEGKTAAALALFKESLHYFPTNDKLALRVETLKTKLLEERTMGTSVQHQQQYVKDDDALEAMFMETTSINSPVKKSATAVAPTRRARTSSVYEENSGLSANQLLVNRLAKLARQRNKEFVPLARFVDSYLEVERVHASVETAEFSRVRFHAMDCAVTPPCTRVETDEDMDAQLYPVEQLIDRLAQCAKMIDEAKRLSPGLPLEFIQALQGHPYGSFLACTASVSLGLQCQCGGALRCKLHAIPVRDRLSQLLSTGMRCTLRRLFNSSSSTVALVANTGSYRFAGDDVAAVVHRALLLLDTRLQLVDKVVLLGTQSSRVDVEDLGRVGEFVQAHQFLMEMFPTDEACAAISDSNQAAWAKFRKYLSVAREFKLHDELVLAPLANLQDFLSQLKQQAPLVKACRGHVDFAYRIALREDKCGQCTCEGARRRRANAMGMWMAPTLQQSSNAALAKSHAAVEKCFACSQAVISGGISCECCEKQFHTACLGLPKGYDSDFVCGKCMPKFNNSTRQ